MHPRGIPPTQARRHVAGFTAIELMVVVSIVAILAALAGPSFTPLIENWRVRESAEQLQSTLHYARSEAIKRGGRVVIQKIPNNTNGCTTASGTRDWDCGWNVCEDTNNNGTCNATETKLQEVSLSGTANIMRKPSGKSLKFDRYGMTNGANILSFTLSPERTGIKTDSTATLCLAAGGRIRVLSGEIDCKKIP